MFFYLISPLLTPLRAEAMLYIEAAFFMTGGPQGESILGDYHCFLTASFHKYYNHIEG
jgi:hypothetical protein